jgi:formyltetrahydrofolate deformylase
LVNYRVLIKTDDKRGLVYKISKLFSDMELNIVSNSEFVDREHQLFFMRSEISGDNCDVDRLKRELTTLLPESSEVKIVDTLKRKRVVILVTKEVHCLGDILMRYYEDELNADIVEVIGNYRDLEKLTSKFDIHFETISHEGNDRETHANIISARLEKLEFDYIVLAKYMRILPPSFVKKYRNKIINIHHSFLPAFIGANPYKQAYERGVKIIGATAHFVTDDLDEGPIIEQSVTHVNHSYSWRDMQKAGRDIEKIVLSKALKLVLEDRVFVYNNRTVIF